MSSLLSDDQASIEVNGIRFETVMPNRTIVMPSKPAKSGAEFEVGMRLTNVTDTPQRMLLYHALLEFHDVQGNLLSKNYAGCDWSRDPETSHCRLLQPGASIVFMKQSKFHWAGAGDEIRTVFVEESGDGWVYPGLTLGQYSIQVAIATI